MMIRYNQTREAVLLAITNDHWKNRLAGLLSRGNRLILTPEESPISDNGPIDLIITDLAVAADLERITREHDISVDVHTQTATIHDDLSPNSPKTETCMLDISAADSSIISVVSRLVDHARLSRETVRLRETVAHSYGFDNIVGISKQIEQLKETAARLAPTDITLLLQGGPGTGKNLLARTIHHHSGRRMGPFVAVDLSAIPPKLLRRDLFGIEGEDELLTDRAGLLEQAEGGTIFLDEVSRVPEELQPVLAQFLQDRKLPAGNPGAGRKVDVRVISSTDRSLTSLVKEGHFDKRLLDLLGVIPIKLVPLAERNEDIEILTDYFLRRICRELGRPTLFITREAVDRLLAYHWPGNVRELENCLRRAATLCKDDTLDVRDITFLSPETTPAVNRTTNLLKARSGGAENGLLDTNQRSVIEQALDENDWNYTQTAQELGIGRTTLWRKVKKYKLKRSSKLENANY